MDTAAGTGPHRPRDVPSQPWADHLICLDFRPSHHHVDDHWCAQWPAAHPALALPEDDHLVLIASNFGLPSNPGWYYNLRAQPYVMITWKGSSIEMRARELSGAERQRYVDLGLKAYPWWEQYHLRGCASPKSR